jgi:hypothetical protein
VWVKESFEATPSRSFVVKGGDFTATRRRETKIIEDGDKGEHHQHFKKQARKHPILLIVELEGNRYRESVISCIVSYIIRRRS